MSFKSSHDVEGTLGECLRELTLAFGHGDYEVSGNQFIVRGENRRLVVHLHYEGERHLGSLDLPMTKVEFEFIGYTEEDKDAVMKFLAEHLIRMGAG